MDSNQAQKELTHLLEHRYGRREAGVIADWVMEHITGWKKLDRLVRKTEPLGAEALENYVRYRDQLLAGRPVQYVLGESWFAGERFFVDERVLIPRPETEELVDWVGEEVWEAREWEGERGHGALLDVGTGSGCIAITLSRRMPGVEVHACDVSEGALAVARRNASGLGAQVSFWGLDFLDEQQWAALPVMRWLVSNPPYIPIRERATMAAHVIEAEPALALFVPDEDALVFYRALGVFARRRLAPAGALFVEIHEDLGAAVGKLLTELGAKEVVLRKDLQGKDRMIKATWE